MPLDNRGYTNPLHSEAQHPAESCGNRKKTRGASRYTKPLHNRGSGIVLNDGRYFYRRRVPASLKAKLGKGEIWRSLGTDSLQTAHKRRLQAAALVERILAAAAKEAGLSTGDQWIAEQDTLLEQVVSKTLKAEGKPAAGMALREVFDAYMADPTHGWSPRTRMAYVTTQRLVLAVFGEDTSIRSITRARCRDFIDILRHMPLNASKRFPGRSPVEIAKAAKLTMATDLISPANINTYLNKLGGVFNWAMREELIERNPTVGLRVPDPTLRRDKRLPFSTSQLQKIFSAPLYTGCQNDEHGYAVPGPNRPKRARFWIPLIGLFNGLRLNEACQLDVADILIVEGVWCFAVTAGVSPTTDKRLKTSSSARLVPVHPELLELGFAAFVEGRKKRSNQNYLKKWPWERPATGQLLSPHGLRVSRVRSERQRVRRASTASATLFGMPLGKLKLSGRWCWRWEVGLEWVAPGEARPCRIVMDVVTLLKLYPTRLAGLRIRG